MARGWRSPEREPEKSLLALGREAAANPCPALAGVPRRIETTQQGTKCGRDDDREQGGGPRSGELPGGEG
jgi:hypothetical protein